MQVMTRSVATPGQRWAIVLAGGEGERMRSLTERCLGHHVPKQYCTFVGSRSMLQHTLDRATRLVSPEQIVTVMGRDHGAFFYGHHKPGIPGCVLEQPVGCDTAPGIFLPATYVLEADPSATLIIFPSDHFVFPEDRFLEHVERAVMLAERLVDRLVLLAATPDRPEPEYGWIEPGLDVLWAWNSGHTAKTVASFREKPTEKEAVRFFRRGYLWNTMIMVVKAKTLWSLGWLLLPQMMRRFEALRGVLDSVRNRGTGSEQQRMALNHIYQDMESANFSRGILQSAPKNTVVMTMKDVDWSDWGRPDRIVRSLARIGKSPSFPLEFPPPSGLSLGEIRHDATP